LRWLLSIALLHQGVDAPWEDTPVSMQQNASLWSCGQACMSALMTCLEAMYCGFRGEARRALVAGRLDRAVPQLRLAAAAS
jgi:hypothetical protein